MPVMECAVCKKRMIYGPEGGSCTECSDKSKGRKNVLGPREYLVERVVSSVRYVAGEGRMSAILEYACMLLAAHGMKPPFSLRNGRINRKDLYETLQNLVSQGHMKLEDHTKDHTWPEGKKTSQDHKSMQYLEMGRLLGLSGDIRFLLVEEHFTVDDSQMGRKMVLLVRALNCHTPREIRQLARNRTPPKIKGSTLESSRKIGKLLSGPRKKSPEWLCPGPRVPVPHQKNWDDTHERRVFWNSKNKEMRPPDHSKNLRGMRGILKEWPVLAKYDYTKAYEKAVDT